MFLSPMQNLTQKKGKRNPNLQTPGNVTESFKCLIGISFREFRWKYFLPCHSRIANTWNITNATAALLFALELFHVIVILAGSLFI